MSLLTFQLCMSRLAYSMRLKRKRNFVIETVTQKKKYIETVIEICEVITCHTYYTC
jgi:hypothetical protein